MIFRSEQTKNNLDKSWYRPDRPFFAAGACHILAAVFLETFPDAGYEAIFLAPDPGCRGGHIFVSDGVSVFDYHGYSNHHVFLNHYHSKIRRFFPHWTGSVHHLNVSPMEGPFCQKYRYRLPEQFLHDPCPRARSYLMRFRTPGGARV